MTTEEYLTARQARDWKFNMVVDGNSFRHVNRIIIFGSSVRYDCDITSDLDICIDWKNDCYDADGVLKVFTRNMRRAISRITNGKADVVNFDHLNGTVVEDAVKEGVVVYGHNV